MSAIWLEKTDIANLVGAGVAVDAELSISELPRVAVAVLPESGPIRAGFSFEKTDSGIVLMNGELHGSVELTCQRCLERIRIEIDDQLRLALLASEMDESKVPQGYELLIIPGGELRLADLIEDEVLLELPLSARHPDGDCGSLGRNLNELKEPAAEMTTPFAGLADMLRDRR